MFRKYFGKFQQRLIKDNNFQKTMPEFTIQYKDLRMTLTQILFLIVTLLLLAYMIKIKFGGLW